MIQAASLTRWSIKLEITILGAHNLESSHFRMVSILIDRSLALDAGGLTSGLSLEQQTGIKAILLTHQHFDHVKDVVSIGLKNAHQPAIQVYASEIVLKILSEHLINGILYPDFTKWPSPENPSLKLNPVKPFAPFAVLDYSVLALPTNHAVPTTGFSVSDSKKTLFYTGDTSSGLRECWRHISPHLIIIELIGPSAMGTEFFRRTGHLSPSLLKEELLEFRKLKNYLPRVVVVHLNPEREAEIRTEIEAINAELGISIIVGREDMKLSL